MNRQRDRDRVARGEKENQGTSVTAAPIDGSATRHTDRCHPSHTHLILAGEQGGWWDGAVGHSVAADTPDAAAVCARAPLRYAYSWLG